MGYRIIARAGKQDILYGADVDLYVLSWCFDLINQYAATHDLFVTISSEPSKAFSKNKVRFKTAEEIDFPRVHEGYFFPVESYSFDERPDEDGPVIDEDISEKEIERLRRKYL